MNIEGALAEAGLSNIWEIKSFFEAHPYYLSTRWSDNKLYCLCYTKGKSILANPVVQEANGTVLEQGTNKVVCCGIDVFREENSSWVANHFDSLQTDGALNYQIIPDGSFVKAYWYDGKWMLSTTRTPDASYSKWEGPTFHSMFMDAVNTKYPKLFEKMSKDFSYTFILQHTDNRIVKPIKEPELFLISVTSMTGETRFHELQELPDLGVPTLETGSLVFPVGADATKESPKEWGDSETDSDMIGAKIAAFVNALSWIFPGVFFVRYNTQTHRYTRVKVENEQFRQVLDLRGNRPNFEYRYLEMINDTKDKTVVSRFLEYYPEKSEEVKKAQENLETTRGEIHDFYCQKYLSRDPEDRRVLIPKCYLDTILALNRQFKKDRQPTTIDTVTEYLATLSIEDQAQVYQISDQVHNPVRLGGDKKPERRRWRRR